MGPAIIPALENIKQKVLIPEKDIELIWADTQCNELHGMKKVVDMWLQKKEIDVIIGDGCSTICNPVSSLASAWNVPMVS